MWILAETLGRWLRYVPPPPRGTAPEEDAQDWKWFVRPMNTAEQAGPRVKHAEEKRPARLVPRG